MNFTYQVRGGRLRAWTSKTSPWTTLYFASRHPFTRFWWLYSKQASSIWLQVYKSAKVSKSWDFGQILMNYWFHFKFWALERTDPQKKIKQTNNYTLSHVRAYFICFLPNRLILFNLKSAMGKSPKGILCIETQSWVFRKFLVKLYRRSLKFVVQKHKLR